MIKFDVINSIEIGHLSIVEYAIELDPEHEKHINFHLKIYTYSRFMELYKNLPLKRQYIIYIDKYLQRIKYKEMRLVLTNGVNMMNQSRLYNYRTYRLFLKIYYLNIQKKLMEEEDI